jgi:hypothetical protein
MGFVVPGVHYSVMLFVMAWHELLKCDVVGCGGRWHLPRFRFV